MDKKYKNIVALIVIVSFISVIFCSCFGSDSSDVSFDDIQNESVFSSNELAVPVADARLSDDIRSFQIQIDNDLFQFPMRYSQLTEAGWTISKYDDEDTQLESGYDDIVRFVKGNNAIDCDVFNPDVSIQSYKNCVISGVAINAFAEIPDATVFIPGGLQLNVATQQEVFDLFGEPDDVFEADNGKTTITYETDNIWSSVKLTFTSDGILHSYDAKNPVAPEDFVFSEAVENNISYDVPVAMTDDIEDRIISFDGDLYYLPAPLSAFLENGWIIEGETETTIGAGSLVFCDISRNGISIHMTAYNDSEYACPVEDGLVKQLDSIFVDEFEVSGGLALDMSPEEAEQILRAGNYNFEVEEMSDGKKYKILLSGDALYNYCNIYFDGDDVKYISIYSDK